MYQWIWEVIHVRKQQDRSMNRDERFYQLPNVYDCLLPSQRHLVDIRSEEGSRASTMEEKSCIIDEIDDL